MADLTGARGSLNIAQGLRRTEIASTILELEPSAAPLTLLLEMAGTEPTGNPEFKWFEDKLEPRFDAINNGAGYIAGATSVVVDNGAYFAQHDLVRVTRTGEVMRVTAVATNTLTVVRGVGGSGIALVDNDELIIIGSAQPEGDTSKPARSSNPTLITNYTQIFRKPVESTETLRHSKTFTSPSDWDRQVKHASIEHMKDIEYAIWMGRSSEDNTGSQPRRTTGGVFQYITTNQTDAGGQLTEAELFGALRPGMRYGSGQNGSRTKVAFCSALAIDVVNGFPRGKLQVIQNDNDTTYGLDVTTFVSPHGKIRVMTHWLFEGAVYGGYMAILDMNNKKRRYLANEEGSRDTRLKENIQAPDADTRKAEWITETGFQSGQQQADALITGITS
jgi:hypothetical protein